MTGIPIVCTACDERAVIPFLPPDLTCVACKTGEHIDLDDGLEVTAASDGDTSTCKNCGQPIEYDEAWVHVPSFAMRCSGGEGRAVEVKNTVAEPKTAALGDPDLPMLNLPGGTPEQDQDMDLLRDTDEKRKVLVPKGSAPYSQRALATKTAADDNGKTCPDCGGTGSVPQGGGEDPDDVDNGHVQCKTCGGTGEVGTEVKSAGDQAKKASLDKVADFASVLSSLSQHNGARVNVTYSSDFKGVDTVSGLLTYASGHATVETAKGLVDIPASQILAVEAVGYGDWADGRTEGEGGSWANMLNAFPSGATAAKQAEYQSDGGVYTGGGCTTPGCNGTVEKTTGPNSLTGVDRFKCSDCGQTYRGPAKQSAKQGSFEDDDAFDAGFEDGLTGAAMVTGAVEYAQGYALGQQMQSKATKVMQIAAAVTESNPGMTGRTALRVARKTIAKYPKVAADVDPDKDIVCKTCGKDFGGHQHADPKGHSFEPIPRILRGGTTR